MSNINKTGLGNSNDVNDDFNPAPLNIEDIMQLRITKVTLRKLYFDYEDRHFAIIDVSDFCNSLLYFYERIFTNDYGFVNMRFINFTDKSIRISWFIRDVSKRHPLTITYSNLDREYFAKALTELGFATSLYADEWAEKKQKIDDIKAEIARLNDQIKDINDEFFKTSGHGSKSYTDETIRAMILPQIFGRDFPYMKDYDHVWEEKPISNPNLRWNDPERYTDMISVGFPEKSENGKTTYHRLYVPINALINKDALSVLYFHRKYWKKYNPDTTEAENPVSRREATTALDITSHSYREALASKSDLSLFTDEKEEEFLKRDDVQEFLKKVAESK